MYGPAARILLRYLVGMALAFGWLPESVASQLSEDPDIVAMIEIGLPVLVGAATETWYAIAKRVGGAT